MRPQRSSVAPTTLPSTPGSVFEPVKPSPPSDLPRASPLPEADMTATLYPCAASSRAQPAPMPRPTAEMLATLPSVMPLSSHARLSNRLASSFTSAEQPPHPAKPHRKAPPPHHRRRQPSPARL